LLTTSGGVIALKDKDFSDLVQTTSLSHKVQDLVKKLLDYFEIKSVAEDGYTYIPYTNKRIKLLDKV
jgi:hypothetical protein